MRLRHRELRLEVPSLFQINALGDKGGEDWCGRTSASMIYNYYMAARAGGMQNALAQLIVNQRDRAPYDLVHSDGKVAVDGYNLLATMQRAKPEGWAYDKKLQGPPELYPVGARRSMPAEHEILQILAPVLAALELHNPALFYSSLSSSTTTPRHIVVISGYRVGPDGALWLHIDDPGSQFRLDDGRMTTWTTAGHVMSGTDEEVLVQLVPTTHDAAAGRRYWLRASRLFQPNDRSARDDLWCDHCDRPGFCVYYNTVSPEPISACVLTSSQDPGLPIDLRDPDGRGLSSTLPIAWDNARRSGAPYPMGTNRAWHNGIHFLHEEATFASKDVLSVAPGELVFVRLPERAQADVEDAGAVLVRHGFDPATQSLYDPRRDAEPPAGTIWIYSLYMHLLGGEAGARHLSARLDHGEKPKLRTFVPAPAECTLFGYDPGGELVALEATFAPGREVPGDETFAIATPAGQRLALRADAAWSNLDAWEDGPRAPLCPAGASKAVYDPLTGKVVELKATVSSKEQIPLEVTCGEDDVWSYVVVDEGKTTWLHAEAEAGLQLHDFAHCVHELSDKKIFAGVPEGCAIAFLRGPELTIHVHDAKLLPGKLYVSGGTEHVRCREDRSQPALGRRAEDGASLWPELEPCIAVSDDAKKAIDAADEPVTPKGATLCYFNPTTGHVLATSLTLRGAKIRRDVTGRYTKDAKHARLEGHALEISIQRARACAHDRGDIDDLLRVKDRMWPLLTCWDDAAAVFTRTNGTGDDRNFPDDSRLSLEGEVSRMSLLEGPCTTGGRLRAWARLPLVVGLDKDARKAKEDELAATFEGPAADSLRRVERGESRLLGVQLRKSDGWEVKDGVLTVQAGRTKPLQLFVEIAGKGKGRHFPEKLTTCDRPIVGVPAAAGLRLRVVSTFSSGAKTPVARALVEVVPTVAKSALKDNSDERDAWDEAEDFASSMREAIAAGGVVDLAELEASARIFTRTGHPFERWRHVGHDPIGTMGLVAAGQLGVHVELFAGQNVLPSDGPIGLWREIRVKSGAEPLSKEFYAEVVSAILEDARLAALAKGERDGTGTVDSGKSGEPAPAEQWRRFCAKEEVDRGLSRIIAVHPSEWMTDWEAAAQQYKLTRYLRGPTAGWWPRDIALEGLSSSDWWFHHPLRLLEWLTTGVDVRVELCSSKATASKLELGGEAYEMSAGDAGEDGEIFRIRTVVGDRAESMEAFVVLEGVDTLEPRIPVALERGEIVRLWLCEPTAAMDHRVLPSRMPSPVALRFADTLAREDTGTTHLLADPSPHLSSCGHARATFEIEARYNVTMPDTLELELSDPAFTIAGVDVTGAAPLPESVVRTGTKLTIPLAPSGRSPTLVTMYRKVGARVDVIASERVGVEATLTATVGGGDLLQPETRSRSIATRVPTRDARGQDVAKLQHYLRQISIEGAPCLRLPEAEVPTIDGHYGEVTARAIWRFVLHFCASPRWDRSLSEIAASTGPRALAPFEAPAPGTIDAAADAALAEHGFPEVSAALVAEIVRHYGMPSVLPALEITVVEPAVDAALLDVVKKMGVIGKTRVPPRASLGAVATARLDVALAQPAVPGDPASVTVSIVTPAGFPYRVAGASTRTLAALIAGGIVLEPEGAHATEANACTLQLDALGLVLASVRLGGTRSLVEGGDSERSLDALLVQSWLRRWPKPDGTPFYGGTLDGQWGGGSSKALTAFRAAVAPDSSYDALLDLLAAGPSAGAKEAAQ